MPYGCVPEDPEVKKIEEIQTVDDIVVYAFKQMAISQRQLDLRCIQLDREKSQFGDRIDDLHIQIEKKHKEAEDWKAQCMQANFHIGELETELYNAKHKKKMKKGGK